MQPATSLYQPEYRPIVRPLSTSSCHSCHRHASCLAHTLEGDELSAFGSIVTHSKKLKRGDYLYRAGDTFDTIYVVRGGSLKTFIIDEEGREQILGFSLQGDIVALDGLFLQGHRTTSQALETTYVCSIPLAAYVELATKIPSLYHELLAKMSNRILEEEEHTLMLGTKSADQRLATLLLNLSERNAARGQSKFELELNMSRRDIGSYLSAAVETVSRIFTRLQALDIIDAHGKHVRIKDINGLRKIAT